MEVRREQGRQQGRGRAGHLSREQERRGDAVRLQAPREGQPALQEGGRLTAQRISSLYGEHLKAPL